jgi:hypothetical protein
VGVGFGLLDALCRDKGHMCVVEFAMLFVVKDLPLPILQWVMFA